MQSSSYQFVIKEPQTGGRLDAFLAQSLPHLSRSQIKKLLQEGHIHLNKKPPKASHLLKKGERLEVRVPPPVPLSIKPQAIELDVLYEDQDIIVINKSADMVVHPGAGNGEGTLVHALLHHCSDLSGIGGKLRPGIVHRLDKGTSGVMVAAKNDKAHLALTEQFQKREVKKVYQALVWGSLSEKSGRFQSRMGRHPKNRKKMASLEAGGREAVTDYKVLKDFHFLSWVEVYPLTGRTHQIRVHFSEVGHAICGDPLYKRGRTKLYALPKTLQDKMKAVSYQLLHAKSLSFRHPNSNRALFFEAPLREELKKFLKLF